VTLFITAYNEERCGREDAKLLALDYPAVKKKIVWEPTAVQTAPTHVWQTGRKRPSFSTRKAGKTAAMNRGMTLVTSPIVVFTDANTMHQQRGLTRNSTGVSVIPWWAV
jgi:hypothetical protein